MTTVSRGRFHFTSDCYHIPKAGAEGYHATSTRGEHLLI
jgi:hypothetical protein